MSLKEFFQLQKREVEEEAAELHNELDGDPGDSFDKMRKVFQRCLKNSGEV